MNYNELAAEVTAQLVAQIETGPGVWRMPWHTVPGLFDVRNAATSNRYRGSNTIALALTALDRGYGSEGSPGSPWWATYKQWTELEAQVRRSETGARIIKWVTVRRPADHNTDEAAPGAGKRGRLVPKVYTVFHASQVEGWTAPATAPANDLDRDARADAWIAQTGAAISYGNDHAAYLPALDVIELPAAAQFDDAAAMYSTTCHELTHWTGHPDRLNRDLSGRFGDDAYAAEELVAELGSAIACSHLHLTPAPREDHAGYLAHWLRILNADPTALFAVAAKAETAVDYLDSLQTDEVEA